MNEEQKQSVKDFRKALNALLLEVDATIVQDLSVRFDKVVESMNTHPARDEVSDLKERIRMLEFMIENGLGWADMVDDTRFDQSKPSYKPTRPSRDEVAINTKVLDILDGMNGIGGTPTPQEFYAEFDMRLRAKLGIQQHPTTEQIVEAVMETLENVIFIANLQKGVTVKEDALRKNITNAINSLITKRENQCDCKGNECCYYCEVEKTGVRNLTTPRD